MAFLFSITITRLTVLRVTPYLLTSLKLYSNTLGTVAASKVQLKIKRLPSVLAVTLGLMVFKLYFWLSKLHVLLCLPHLPVFGQRYLHEYKVGNVCTRSTPSNLHSEEHLRRRKEWREQVAALFGTGRLINSGGGSLLLTATYLLVLLTSYTL